MRVMRDVIPHADAARQPNQSSLWLWASKHPLRERLFRVALYLIDAPVGARCTAHSLTFILEMHYTS